MRLFSKKEKKVNAKPIPGPTAPATPGSVSPPASAAPIPGPGSVAPKPGVPAFGSAPSPVPPSPAGGFKLGPGLPGSPSPMTNAPSPLNNSNVSFGANDSSKSVSARKFDVFGENERYVKFDFSKLKIDKLDLSTNPDPRAIRKHVKKLIELQKQLIAMEKDLTCRRDFIDKIIFEEKENQKPKLLVDLLEGKEPVEKSEETESKEDKESNNKEEKATSKAEKSAKKVDAKKTSSEKEKSIPKKENNDIFKEVESMISEN